MGTLSLSSFEGGLVRFEVDYSDTTQRVNRVRCINNGSRNARCTLLVPITGLIAAQATFGPGTTQASVPAGLVLGRTEDGDPDLPYNVQIQYPVP